MLKSGNKKGYMRTMEAFLAFIITFSFLIIILNRPVITYDYIQQGQVLENLALDDNFRNGIFSIVGSCSSEASNLLVANMTKELIEGYSFNICNEIKPTLPPKNVYVESVMISGNTTNLLNDPIIKLYYWKD